MYVALTSFRRRATSCPLIAGVDLLLITWIIWLTGGVESGLYILYCLPVIHLVLAQDVRFATAGAILASGLYTLATLLTAGPYQFLTIGLSNIAKVAALSGILVLFLALLKREIEMGRALQVALHESLGRAAAVYGVAHVANVGADLRAVLTALLEHAGKATGASAGIVARVEPQGGLRETATWMRGRGGGSAEAQYPDCRSPEAKRALVQSMPVVAERRCEAGRDKNAASTASPSAKVIYVPLSTMRGPVGVLGLAAGREQEFTRSEVEFLKSLCLEAAVAIENAQLREELRQMAVTDYLTGVANRRGIEQFLTQQAEGARSRREPLTVLMLDVDGLKRVNDVHGHAAGDEVLCALGRVLERHVRGRGEAGRIGGDEFLVVLPGTTGEQGEALAHRIVDAFQRELARAALPEALSPCPGLSIGVAALERGEESPDMRWERDLIFHADAALYEAKEHGKGQVRSVMSSSLAEAGPRER